MANLYDRPAFSASERTFYLNAKARAKALGISQRQIAQALELSDGFVSEFLNLKNRLASNRFDELAAVLQTEVAQLFTFGEEIPKSNVQKSTATDGYDLLGQPNRVDSASQRNQGVSADAVPVQAHPMQPRADLQRDYADIAAAINTLVEVKIRIAGALGVRDGEELDRAELPQASVGGVSERRSRQTAHGRTKAASDRRTGVR